MLSNYTNQNLGSVLERHLQGEHIPRPLTKLDKQASFSINPESVVVYLM